MNQYVTAVSAEVPRPAPIFAYGGTLPNTDCVEGSATLVPHLRRELEAEELLMRLLVDDFRSREQFDFGEIIAGLEPSFELAHVFAVAREPSQLHRALRLQVRSEPEPAGVPVRVVDLGGVVALELLEPVAVGRGTAARGEHVGELEQRRGWPCAGSL